jgi:hypothetical protein
MLAIIGAVLLLLTLQTVTSAGKSRKPQRIAAGTWGGQHVRMEVTASSATLEYDCANGTITGPLTIDRRGRFNWRGTHTREHGGPIRADEKSNTRPARYTGSTDGKKITLTVTLTDTNETVGTYALVRGQQGRVFKCL